MRLRESFMNSSAVASVLPLMRHNTTNLVSESMATHVHTSPAVFGGFVADGTYFSLA